MDDKPKDEAIHKAPNQANVAKQCVFKLTLLLGLIGLWTFRLGYQQPKTPNSAPVKKGCPFPLPNHLLKEQPLRPGEGPLAASSRKLHGYLSQRTSYVDIDSISMAVVTPTGTVFEHCYGSLKANETFLPGRRVTRDSIYRIASITKMFTVLETLILRERGALNLDDPVEKYLPDIKYPSYGWSEYLKGEKDGNNIRPHITLRQLASHMSGIGRDYPPYELRDWPQDSLKPLLEGIRAKSSADIPFPKRDYAHLVESVNKYPLINLPYDYPIYSNTGMDLLGLANVAANNHSQAHPEIEPHTHEDLIKRDIFGPLKLNSSFYRVPYETAQADLAVPNKNHEWADFMFDDADAPAGGQYSSLADLEAVLQSFLDPAANNGVVSEHVVREWLHPLFTWKDGFQETGGPWEITVTNSGVRLYMKGGNLPGYHSEFVIVPELQYGIIVLVTGTYSNTARFVHEAVTLFQPAIQALLKARVDDAYAGRWAGSDDDDQQGATSAEVKVIDGGLYMTELVVRGYDVLKIVEDAENDLQDPYPIALWSTGRPGEFRLAIGRKELNDDPLAGCGPYWISIDSPIHSGAPIDLVYWDDEELIYPSAGARFWRV